MNKGLLFALSFGGILATMTILTYHWFFNNPSMLLVMLALCSLSLTTNLAVLYNKVHLKL